MAKIKGSEKLKVGIVVSRYLNEITDELLKGARDVLKKSGVRDANIRIVEVPGSFEIPFGCVTLLKKNKPDAIIALGCVIKGETNHDHYIASAVSQGITRLTIDYKIPISFGVITTNNLKQAKVRASGTNNKGAEAALAALRCALIR
jgi:6,7-dimethyl-8-ribityllumazine synthase